MTEEFRLLAKHYRNALENIVTEDDLEACHAIACTALSTNPAPSDRVVGAARAFMELFVIDNGDERGLSIEGIDMTELTHCFAALESVLAASEGSTE